MDEYLKEAYQVESYVKDHKVKAIMVSSQLFPKIGAHPKFKVTTEGEFGEFGIYAGKLSRTKVYVSPTLTGVDRFIIIPDGEVINI